jgi:hypothetical protein
MSEHPPVTAPMVLLRAATVEETAVTVLYEAARLLRKPATLRDRQANETICLLVCRVLGLDDVYQSAVEEVLRSLP